MYTLVFPSTDGGCLEDRHRDCVLLCLQLVLMEDRQQVFIELDVQHTFSFPAPERQRAVEPHVSWMSQTGEACSPSRSSIERAQGSAALYSVRE